MSNELNHEPARSYDVGCYLWGGNFSLTGPEARVIHELLPHLNQETMAHAFENIQRSFDFDMVSAFIPT
ncbi:hypothetical protein RIVERRIDER_3 [Xanthomonas phage RiverRider]|uniref:Uncharacterized protein n=1 Tax=Xanthomonas phage RiverRider TaxID=2108116 RepID=A0A2P1JUR1_9CAUD|nr:hypothetical protein HWB58_gp03 [Xanthomonas phage RiverRider]AVO23091.1 hypothetical protein RIVERRIDER_3 [Xanthomonas phage RiverRider]